MASIDFPSLSVLILHPTFGPVLFDTGYASHFHRATMPFPERFYRWVTPVNLPEKQALSSQLRRFNLTLEDIRVCVISHFHADHIAGLRDLPNARFISMRADYEQVTGSTRIGGLIHGQLPSLLPDDFAKRIDFAENAKKVKLPLPWKTFGEGFDLLDDGSLIGIALPGHSCGQLGLLLKDDAGRDVFLCADACWSRDAFLELRMPSLLARPLMHSWQGYRETLQKIHMLSAAHEELAILPSHCEKSLISYQPDWSMQ